MTETTTEPLLDLGGAARLLNVAERTVRHLVATRQLPVHRVGGQLRFSRRELLDATRITAVRPG